MEKKQIYVDNAATTKVHPLVIQKMTEIQTSDFGNPSSIYSLGSDARTLVENARRDIAATINAEYNEIFFTGCGTEADNWAIKGVAARMKSKGKNHIITTAFEHHAVLHPLEYLEKLGYNVTYLPVYENGIVKLSDIEAAIRPETGLVTIMYANNEIGTVQPISEIGKLCREREIVFHTDAVAAYGSMKIDVQRDNIDLMSLSAHKIHGPKGVGALYIKRGTPIDPILHGGAQERGRRAGTENVAGICGFSLAARLTFENLENNNIHLKKLQEAFIKGASEIEKSRLNGDMEHRLPGNVNMCFEGVEGESVLLMLDMNGISASSGSACTSGSLDPSHVLLAIGLPHEIAHGSLRITFSEKNTMDDVEYILEKLPQIIEKLRSMSPLWEKLIDR